MNNPNLFYYNPSRIEYSEQTKEAEICIYGGTSAGIAAAVHAARMGRDVILLEPGGHLGGLSSAGLCYTDTGNKDAIGGIAREFYRRVGQEYDAPEEWRFEPHVAERVWRQMVQEASVPVFYRQFLSSVSKDGAALVAITMESGLTVSAKAFIDATYEGDLVAHAGVTCFVGRESNRTYGESLNGVQIRDQHQFELPVDPYVVPGNPSSGLLPGINPNDPGPEGEGDHRVQAYNFRLCLTDDPQNRLPFPKPAAYDRQAYELLARYFAAGWTNVFRKLDPIRNHKVDMNNYGAVSTDYIGANYEYPDGDYWTRERIFQAHVIYQQGLMWFLTNDSQVPESIRNGMSQWGLPRDEFVETGGWPHQLYIREARRMVAEYVMTEHNCRGAYLAPDSVGLAAYPMDSHNCQRFVRNHRVWNEGDVQIGGFQPYPISYRSVIPKRSECGNLLVPVCVSASHIAYGSIRMEPVFMILGQSCATAASLALDLSCAVQDVPYSRLKARLESDSQILAWSGQDHSRG